MVLSLFSLRMLGKVPVRTIAVRGALGMFALAKHYFTGFICNKGNRAKTFANMGPITKGFLLGVTTATPGINGWG
jgi:hypothetical protein